MAHVQRLVDEPCLGIGSDVVSVWKHLGFVGPAIEIKSIALIFAGKRARGGFTDSRSDAMPAVMKGGRV